MLVHEGQASGGHYWAYIYHPLDQQWRKYNDIMVSEVTWEEVERESLGGYRHVSAYCVMYVDVRREKCLQADNTSNDLPADLRQLVEEDNASFERGLCDWDKKQAAKISGLGSNKTMPGNCCRVTLVCLKFVPCAIIDCCKVMYLL